MMALPGLRRLPRARMRGVTTSGNGVDVIAALAGTARRSPPARSAVDEDVGYHLVGWRRPIGRCASSPRRPGSRHRRWIDDALAPRALIVLNEAGRAPARRIERLLELAAAEDAKLIVIADSGRRASAQRGGWLHAVGSSSIRAR